MDRIGEVVVVNEDVVGAYSDDPTNSTMKRAAP